MSEIESEAVKLRVIVDRQDVEILVLKAERDRYVAENSKLWARIHAAQDILAGQKVGGS